MHLNALSNLEELNVAYTGITDRGLLAWTGLANLRSLNLDSCNIHHRQAAPGLTPSGTFSTRVDAGVSKLGVYLLERRSP